MSYILLNITYLSIHLCIIIYCLYYNYDRNIIYENINIKHDSYIID